MGLPLPGTQFRIIDGEVEVIGKNVMSCYWKNEAATKEVLKDGWLKTGDLGFVRNEYLVLTGRKKEILLRGGETIAPVEVEEEYRWRGLDGEFSVISIDSEELGQEVGLIGPSLNLEFIENNLRNVLPSKYKPTYVEYGVLRATSTGKPQRRFMGAELKNFELSKKEFSEMLYQVDQCTSEEAKHILEKFDCVGLWSIFSSITNSIIKARFNEWPHIKNLKDTTKLPKAYYIKHHVIDNDKAGLLSFREVCNKLPVGCGFIFAEEIGSVNGQTPGIIKRLQKKMKLYEKNSLSPSRTNIMNQLHIAGFTSSGYMAARYQKFDLGTVFWGLKTAEGLL